MKKIIVFVFVFALLLCGCSSDSEKNADSKATNKATTTASNTANSAETIEVSEIGYVSKINEIYTNPDSYLGKNILIEGCFTSEVYNGNTYYYVYRTGPGCCGNDGAMCGFEFTFDGSMPSSDDWIRVEGELNQYTEGEQTYLTIKAKSVDVLTQRGMATVS